MNKDLLGSIGILRYYKAADCPASCCGKGWDEKFDQKLHYKAMISDHEMQTPRKNIQPISDLKMPCLGSQARFIFFLRIASHFSGWFFSLVVSHLALGTTKLLHLHFASSRSCWSSSGDPRTSWSISLVVLSLYFYRMYKLVEYETFYIPRIHNKLHQYEVLATFWRNPTATRNFNHSELKERSILWDAIKLPH